VAKTPELKVVFDTNVLFTQVASDLIRSSLGTLIEENSDHADLKIEWHLPAVVVGERKYQMLERAKELLPSLQKMERLLGHSFAISEDTLELHVQKAIDGSINKYDLKVAELEVEEVDWRQIIQKSIFRQSPFEPGDKEKGFRDAVIAHTFLQLHSVSPKTPSICRLVLVSEDARLREYVSEESDGSANVRILSSLDELESLINTLVSSIPEDLAKDLADKAANLFFEKDNEKSLYYKEAIRDQIRSEHGEALKKSPLEGLAKEGKTWWIAPPIFMKKVKSKINWTSMVEPEFDLYHMEDDAKTAADSLSEIFSSQSKGGSPRMAGLGSLLTAKKVVDHTGRDLFEVHWSAVLSQAGNLTKPKIEKINYLGNDLAE
tara:strand:- start:78 stop:1205 length:1128 start_codon:yes stop_codon:yes gene_type:complete